MAVVVGVQSQLRVLVLAGEAPGVRLAANRREARRRARDVLVQGVGDIRRDLRLARLVVRRRRGAVADGVVVEVFREARDRLAVLRAASRCQLAAGVVGVAVD